MTANIRDRCLKRPMCEMHGISNWSIQTYSSSNPTALTSMRRFASVPNKHPSVIGWAGKHIVIDRADGQAVHSIDMQEHVQSFPPAGSQALIILLAWLNRWPFHDGYELIKTFWYYSNKGHFTHLSTSWRITCSSFPVQQQIHKAGYKVKEKNTF